MLPDVRVRFMCMTSVDHESVIQVHEEADQLIIKFFGLLSIADPSGHSAVLDCSQALPAMVLHLQVLTSSIYEDEEHSIFPKKALPCVNPFILQSLAFLLEVLGYSMPLANWSIYYTS